MSETNTNQRHESDTKKIMIQYLLGTLPKKEEEDLEELYFTEDNYFEQLRIVEIELIDSYLHQNLSIEERRYFEQRFLTSPERYKKVEIARALLKAANEAQTNSSRSDNAAKIWRDIIQIIFQPQNRKLNFVLAASGIMALVGGSWLLNEHLRLRSQLKQTQDELVSLRALEQQMSIQKERSDKIDKELTQERDQRHLLEEKVASLLSSSSKMLTFILNPGLVRGGNTKTKLTIPPNTELIQLQLNLEQSFEFKNYRVEIETAEGKKIPNLESVRIKNTNSGGKAILVELSANLLVNNDYLVTLYGLSSNGNGEKIGGYYFRVLNK